MTGQKGRSGGARPRAGRHFVSVWSVLAQQMAQGQVKLLVQFPDEQEPIPFEALAYNQKIGLYDMRRFPNLKVEEE